MTGMLTATSEHGRFDSSPKRGARGRVPTRAWRGGEDHVAPLSLDLLPAVDRNVIPRLHAALRQDLQRPRHPLISAASALHDEVKDLADRLLGGDLDAACERIDVLRAAGRSVECIYLKLLAPTACYLRDLWSDDLCSLADVTFAFCNLQSVLRAFAQDFYSEAASPGSGLRVLIVTPSGEGTDLLTPMFGLIFMSHFFRRDGWDATIERAVAGNTFQQTIGEWFDLVEVLAGNDTQLDEIAAGIRAIRRKSPNPSIGVVVCGQIFCARPDYISLVGADLSASDPLSSLLQARSYLSTSSQAKSFATRQPELRRLS